MGLVVFWGCREEEYDMDQVQIGDAEKEVIDELIASGVCEDAGAAVRISLAILHEHQDELKELRAFVKAGMEDVRAGRVLEPVSVEDTLLEYRRRRDQRLAG